MIQKNFSKINFCFKSHWAKRRKDMETGERPSVFKTDVQARIDYLPAC